MSRILTVLTLVLSSAACSTRTTIPVVASDPAPSAGATLSAATHWSRNSAEHAALFTQTYRVARERLRTLVAGRTAGSWAVILDADETVLDNSTYQKEMEAAGLGYTADSWKAWVLRIEAPALPGAADFIASVRSMGGRVAIVTNRLDEVCRETRQNLANLEIAVDVVLCQTDAGDKNPRFDLVRNGRTPAGLPPVDVVMWVGDNIQDFPGLSQQSRMLSGAFDEFGGRFILLPNPMYGSWVGNPAR